VEGLFGSEEVSLAGEMVVDQFSEEGLLVAVGVPGLAFVEPELG
jgi:hypothetical protein